MTWRLLLPFVALLSVLVMALCFALVLVWPAGPQEQPLPLQAFRHDCQPVPRQLEPLESAGIGSRSAVPACSAHPGSAASARWETDIFPTRRQMPPPSGVDVI